MLNFTYNIESITGTFNGRFAFRAPMSLSPLPYTVLNSLANGDENALDPDVIRHEYLHWLVFRQSGFGIETIGRRFYTRKQHMKQNHNEIIKYYRQRTAYFNAAYRTHEKIVDELYHDLDGQPLSKIMNTRLNKTQIKMVQSSDVDAVHATRMLSATQPVNLRCSSYVKGYLATLEYGLQNYVPDEFGIPAIREIALPAATKGIINASHEHGFGPKGSIINLFKYFRKRMNTENRHGGLTMRHMSTWAALKFSSEAEALGELRYLGLDTHIEFNKYAEQVSDFALRYTLIGKDPILKYNLTSLILDCQHHSWEAHSIETLAQRFEAFGDSILFYFYIHGN